MSEAPRWRIAAEDPESDAARALLDELSEALAAITGSSGRASFDADDVRGPRAGFVVARDGEGVPAGCGAFRPLSDDVAELKRMFVRPAHRGLGTALLAHLEDAARRAGYRALWLETRAVNERAVGFYRARGYSPIPNFGKYVGRTEAVCFARDLEPAQ